MNAVNEIMWAVIGEKFVVAKEHLNQLTIDQLKQLGWAAGVVKTMCEDVIHEKTKVKRNEILPAGQDD